MKTFNEVDFVSYDEAVNYLGKEEFVDELFGDTVLYYLKDELILPVGEAQNTQSQFMFNGFITMVNDDYANVFCGQNMDKAPIGQFRLSENGTGIRNGETVEIDLQQFYKLKNNGIDEQGVSEKQYCSNKIYFNKTVVEKWAEDHGISIGSFEIKESKNYEGKEGWRKAFEYKSKSLNKFYIFLEENFFDRDGNPIYEGDEGYPTKKSLKDDVLENAFVDAADRIITNGERKGGMPKVTDQS